MSEGAMRAVIGIVALLLGLAIGWLVARGAAPPPTPRTPIAGKFVVVVGPTAADVHPPKQPISKQRGDQILWVAAGPGRDLVIESEQRIFEQQTQQGNGRWAMTCADRTCESNGILASAALGRYKYWQLFRQGGQTVEEADGWIIIDR